MEQDRLQRQRFELKYAIEEPVALAVRDFVSSYLELDEYGATLPNYSYPVHSLYLDSPALALYQATINGDKNRYKLRLRFYEDRPEAPVYFEIKRRTNNTISKQRGGVRPMEAHAILAGYLPEPSQLISKDPRQLVALQRFSELMHSLQAKPVAHIAYLREAWVNREDNSVRVTLDREVRCEPDTVGRLVTQMENPVVVFGKLVILELKFTNRFPNWFADLVRSFGLMQCGAAKYVDGLTLVHDRRAGPAALHEDYDAAFHRINGDGKTLPTRRRPANLLTALFS